jgi:hypothetical protein
MLTPLPLQPGFRLDASSSSLRGVTCENCGCEYVYKITRRVMRNTGQPTEGFAKDAMRAADKAAAQGHDPVECPDCGFLQRGMVRSLKAERIAILVLVAMGAAFLTAVLLLVANVAEWASGPAVPATFGVMSVVAIVFLAIHQLLRDINTPDRMRKRVAKPSNRALRRRDFPELSADNLEQESSPAGKLEIRGPGF